MVDTSLYSPILYQLNNLRDSKSSYMIRMGLIVSDANTWKCCGSIIEPR